MRRYECGWAGCDRLPRGFYSLVGHVQDSHLSTAAQQQALIRRQSGQPPPQPMAPRPPQIVSPASVLTAEVRYVAASRFAAQSLLQEVIPQCTFVYRTAAANLYPVDAAMQAIRRHTTVPELLATENGMSGPATATLSFQNGAPHLVAPAPVAREGPVTKHIRLTAALTLRNFVTSSPSAKA